MVQITVKSQYKTVQTVDNTEKIGGTAWESNPPDLARRSQAVLKTVEDTSTPFSPRIIIVEKITTICNHNTMEYSNNQ
jgi:hypothetical protein